MGNKKFSRLAILGLACIVPLSLATVDLSGGMRLDSYSRKLKLVSGDHQKDKHWMEITRARLNMHGDLAKDWTYYIRFDATQGLGSPPNPHNYGVSQAFVTWHGFHQNAVSFGQGAVPSFSADEHYYKPYIIFDEDTDIATGLLRSKTGDHLGLHLNYGFDSLSCSVGAWKETGSGTYELVLTDGDDEFSASYYVESTDNPPIRVGWGGRMSFTPVQADLAGLALGVGISRTPVSYLVTMIGSDGQNSQSYQTQFNQKNDYIIDLSLIIDSIQVNAGYSLEKLSSSDYAGTLVSTGSGTVNDLLTTGKATGLYAEFGYLLKGDSYKMCRKTGSIAGIKHYVGESAFEVVFRAGIERRTDALAVLDGDNDGSYTYDNRTLEKTGTTTSSGTTSVNTHYRTKKKYLSVHANYYMTPKIAIKSQYNAEGYRLDNFDGTFSKGNGETLNVKSIQSFSMRAEYYFDMN